MKSIHIRSFVLLRRFDAESGNGTRMSLLSEAPGSRPEVTACYAEPLLSDAWQTRGELNPAIRTIQRRDNHRAFYKPMAMVAEGNLERERRLARIRTGIGDPGCCRLEGDQVE